MAHITRERTGELLRGLFAILSENPDGLQARDALAQLEGRVVLTDYEKGNYESGRRFEKIVRFATVDAVKAGWMRKQKGVWSVTDDGLAALKKFKQPEDLYREATRLYRQWKLSQAATANDDVGPAVDDEDIGREIGSTFEEAEERAWQEIREYLSKVPPYEFQNMVAALLEVMGYYVSWIAPPGKDGGMDIIAWTDPLGTKPPRIKVQVKRRADNIPVAEVRSFMAVLGPEEVGLFVTTGGFTKDAEDEARMQSSRKVTLINRERFVELWQEYYDKLPDEARKKFPLRPIYFLAPAD